MEHCYPQVIGGRRGGSHERGGWPSR
jgi:hypothetical protein